MAPNIPPAKPLVLIINIPSSDNVRRKTTHSDCISPLVWLHKEIILQPTKQYPKMSFNQYNEFPGAIMFIHLEKTLTAYRCSYCRRPVHQPPTPARSSNKYVFYHIHSVWRCCGSCEHRTSKAQRNGQGRCSDIVNCSCCLVVWGWAG